MTNTNNHPLLSRLRASGVGFDSLFDTLGSITTEAVKSTFPAYNIERLGEDDYKIELAVAGYSQAELDITAERSLLTVKGTKEVPAETKEYLFQGIAARNFERTFTLGEYVEVKEVTLGNGLLTISLRREIPDSKKPKKFDIVSG